MSELPFIKMHGLGNDFVVLDARRKSLELNAAQVRVIADRRVGVGCDQVITIEPPRDGKADVFMRIRNSDGGEVSTCGNAARCIADLVMQENNSDTAVIETAAGLLNAKNVGGGMISVDMGPARLDWRHIPLTPSLMTKSSDTLHLDVAAGPFSDPAAVGMGNPHAVFFVENAEAAPLETFGPELERHPMFPEGVNVGAAQVISTSEIRLRVWERGSGLTRACGSGACAAVVAANRRGLSGREADVIVDGGRLNIEWTANDHVLMRGPAAVSFIGSMSDSLL